MEKLKILLSGLLFKCPLEEEIFDCPFCDLRKLEIIMRLRYLESLSDDETIKIISIHNNCLSLREMKDKKDKKYLIEKFGLN